MTFKTIFQHFLVIACIFQIVLALIAENQGYYIEAAYEMLWLFFFIHFLDKELK